MKTIKLSTSNKIKQLKNTTLHQQQQISILQNNNTHLQNLLNDANNLIQQLQQQYNLPTGTENFQLLNTLWLSLQNTYSSLSVKSLHKFTHFKLIQHEMKSYLES